MDYHSIPSTDGPHTLKPCHQRSSKDGFVATHSDHHSMVVNPLLVDAPDQSPCLHPTVPRFIVGSPPKARTAPSHAQPLWPLPQRTSHTWCQQMTRQQLAVDAAHALLSGVSSHLHPLSLKYQSPAQSPSDPHTPDRVAEATHTNHRQQ
jgi:hypothetical protein